MDSKREIKISPSSNAVEAHSQRIETLGALAAGIAHDFNNHLAAVLGQVSLVLNQLDPQHHCYKRLASAERAALRCAEISKRLVILGRQAPISNKSIEVKRFLDESANLIRHLLPTTIELIRDINISNISVTGDETQLQQVLLNLAVNARDAMPIGGKLTLSAREIELKPNCHTSYHPSPPPGRYLAISVTDTGHGIPEDKLSKIFDPFFTTKSEKKGSGLGLSMAYSIITSHEGSLLVRSNLQIPKTTFSFILPVSEFKPPKNEDPLPETEVANGTETILVADDDKMVLQMVRSALKFKGYSVIPAKDGVEALEKFREYRDEIKLVLLDQTMPKLTGREVIHELAKEAPEIPVVLTSGYTNYKIEQDKEGGSKVGFIPKPYPIQKLLTLVREMLDEE